MTNTLHRFGDADSFRDDYVIAAPHRGRNDENAGSCFCSWGLFNPTRAARVVQSARGKTR